MCTPLRPSNSSTGNIHTLHSNIPSDQYATNAHSPDDTVHGGTAEDVHRGVSLNSLCASILQAPSWERFVEGDATVRSVLGAVVLAVHLLPPSAIVALARLEVRRVMSVLRSIQPLLKLHEDPDETVLPFHKLLPDLLISPTRCTDRRFYISLGKFHSEIALNCLKLMNKTLGDGSLLRNYPANSGVDYPPVTAWLFVYCYPHFFGGRHFVILSGGRSLSLTWWSCHCRRLGSYLEWDKERR